jgi:hypothetical protein
MKSIRTVALTAVFGMLATSGYAADVGVSVTIGQPGFYGQIDIGNFPQPQVLNAQPVVIERVDPNRPPIYLHVPPGYERHWKRHCREYHACGERVFFVHDDWYKREYVPRYQEMHRGDRHEERRDEHRDRREERRDRRDEREERR